MTVPVEPRMTVPVALWPEVAGRYRPVADGRMHFVDLAGPGTDCPTVILLHKVGGWAADWRHVAPLLVRRYRVVAVDLPGHGGSTMDIPPPYAQPPQESAALVLDLLDHLGIEAFHVVGNSLGGIIGMLIATTAPTRTHSVSMVGSSLADRMSVAEITVGDARVRADFTDDWIPLPRGARGAQRFGTDDPAVYQEQDLSRARAGRWVRPSERGVGLLGVAEHLDDLTSPTLILNGSRGMYLRYESVARERIRDVRVQRIDGSGSFVHQEAPERTAAVLTDFVDQVERGRADQSTPPRKQEKP